MTGTRLLAFALSAALVMPVPGPAAAPPPSSAPAAVQTEPGADAFSTEQLDALLAPIALYPDTLLTQMLMASTYPVQIVQAARWLDNEANKKLTGDALVKALESQSWDPSVKSLVPFPQVIATMSDHADWTEQLGYAFANQQADVLASVQRLRLQAQEAGTLKSNDHMVVRTEPAAAPAPTAPPAVAPGPAPGAAAPTEATDQTLAAEGAPQTIYIESSNPQVVYVPSYNPTTAYGTWPYASYPPVAWPPPPGYAVGNALLTGLAFGTGIAITAGLWNLGTANWGRGYANVNVNRYNQINVNRTQIQSDRWQSARANGMAARPARSPGGPVGRPVRSQGLPANAIGRPSVRVPASAVNRPERPSGTNRPKLGTGGTPGQRPGGAGRPAQRPGGGQNLAGRGGAGQGAANRPGAGQRPAQRPGGGQNFAGRPGGGQVANRPSAGRPATRPSYNQGALSGMRDGNQARNFGARGAQSRQIQRADRGGGAWAGNRGGGGVRAGGGGGGGRAPRAHRR